MPVPTEMAQALVELISNLNPYVNYANETGTYKTGEMDIYAVNSSPTIPPSGSTAQIAIEIDSKYPSEWSFKGQPQRVSKAVRIRYRFPVLDPKDSTKILYYVDDYMLLGFEGANGG